MEIQMSNPNCDNVSRQPTKPRKKNALAHGIYGKDILLPWESRKDRRETPCGRLLYGRGRMNAGQLNIEYRSMRTSRFDPDATPKGFDDRSADGKSHSHTVWLCREEGIEDMLHVIRIDARA